jgi:hypothetical protein
MDTPVVFPHTRVAQRQRLVLHLHADPVAPRLVLANLHVRPPVDPVRVVERSVAAHHHPVGPIGRSARRRADTPLAVAISDVVLHHAAQAPHAQSIAAVEAEDVAPHVAVRATQRHTRSAVVVHDAVAQHHKVVARIQVDAATGIAMHVQVLENQPVGVDRGSADAILSAGDGQVGQRHVVRPVELEHHPPGWPCCPGSAWPCAPPPAAPGCAPRCPARPARCSSPGCTPPCPRRSCPPHPGRTPAAAPPDWPSAHPRSCPSSRCYPPHS